MRIYTRVLLWLFLLLSGLSAHAHLPIPIFSCIQNRNLNCLKEEIKIDPSWKNRRNRDGDSPFVAALKLHYFSAARYMIEMGAGNELLDIVRAYNILFRDGKSDCANLSEIKKSGIENNSDLIKRIVLAISQSISDKEFVSKAVAIIDLFGEKSNIANVIHDLGESQELIEYDVQVIISNYKEIFLRDGPLPDETIREIIIALMRFDIKPHLLRFLIDAYLLKRATNKNMGRNLTLIMDIRDDKAEILATAIAERSRIITAESLSRHYVGEVYNGDSNCQLINHSKESDSLSVFICDSISHHDKKNKRKNIVKFWGSVYMKLIKKRDMRGAFAVAVGLNNISDKSYGNGLEEAIEMADITSNFKNYRDQCREFNTVNFFPSLVIILRDLTVIKEMKLFTQESGAEVLIKEAVDYLLQFKKTNSAHNRYANSFSYLTRPGVTGVLLDLPRRNSEIFVETCKVLIGDNYK